MITENKSFLDPKKVYIPLTDKTFKIASVKVEEGDTVLQGQVVANKYNGKHKTPVLSSVSGEVLGFEERLDRFGKIIDHIIISNDMNYTPVKYKVLSDEVTPAEVRNRLVECGISQVTVDGNFTDIDFTNPVKHIIINATYTNEPFITIDHELIKSHSEAIADGISLLGKAAYTESLTVIADKNMDPEALEALGKATVDKGIKVELINVDKVEGWDYKIAQNLVKETLSNNLLDNGIIYTSIEAAYMTHDAVRNDKPLSKRHVVVSGDGFKDNAIYEIRLGTPFSELAEDNGGYNLEEELNLHVGSFLTGQQLQNDDFSITASVDTVNVGVLREEEEDVCIKCGECNDVCPAGILPQNIMDAELRSVNDRIVDLNTNECVECGLCTYVCPSKINVLEWVRRAKRRVG